MVGASSSALRRYIWAGPSGRWRQTLASHNLTPEAATHRTLFDESGNEPTWTITRTKSKKKLKTLAGGKYFNLKYRRRREMEGFKTINIKRQKELLDRLQFIGFHGFYYCD